MVLRIGIDVDGVLADNMTAVASTTARKKNV